MVQEEVTGGVGSVNSWYRLIQQALQVGPIDGVGERTWCTVREQMVQFEALVAEEKQVV